MDEQIKRSILEHYNAGNDDGLSSMLEELGYKLIIDSDGSGKAVDLVKKEGSHTSYKKVEKAKESNPFYTAEPIWKSVKKEEFDSFIENYPRELCCNVNAMCDPPSVTFNDFALANRWPYSVVATTHAYDDEPGKYFYCPEEDRAYSTVTNFEELFESKTGYKET